MSVLDAAVAYLFVPANRPDRFAKALATGAVPILDLEDAVSADDKALARTCLAGEADAVSRSLVRINAAETDDFERDFAAISPLAPVGIMLPKVESARDIERARSQLGHEIPIVALVETARGFGALDEIAGSPGVARLAFGSVDLCVDLGLRSDAEIMTAFRAQLVLASRIAGLSRPIDGVCALVDDADAMARHARRAASCGFGGVLCIHPRQVAIAEGAFMPSAADVERARRIVDAAQSEAVGAIKVDGAMVDRPVIELARRTLALHRRAAEGLGQ